MNDHIVRVVGVTSLAALVFALAGCASLPEWAGGAARTVVGGSASPPIVRATNQGTSSLTLVACPLQPNALSSVSELIQMLSSQSPIVTADQQATARLILNLCPSIPGADVLREAARLRR